jgi:O-glycosyl hydrolase
MIWILCF